ncbi:MAG: cytidine deaminase [Planctomycetes bacterium]|nr:cytidine deaminase [Planctomycetota bacterium]
MSNPSIQEHEWEDGELVIGLVFPTGVNYREVINPLKDRLKLFDYVAEEINISGDVIPELSSVKPYNSELERISNLQDAGNSARERSKANSILAAGAVSSIGANRLSARKRKEIRSRKDARKRVAYIVKSLKRPEEVALLRAVYGHGFYLIGIHQDEAERVSYLKERAQVSRDEAQAAIDRDSDEKDSDHGQRLTDTFHLSDFFLRVGQESSALERDVWRLLDIVFAYPHMTPCFDEYAMFMAYSASLRSADLSRQVGAVIAQEHDLIATGANDAPKYGGGHYWAKGYSLPKEPLDEAGGRDYVRGYDSNKRELLKLLRQIEDNLISGNDGAELSAWKDEVTATFDALSEKLRASQKKKNPDLEATLESSRQKYIDDSVETLRKRVAAGLKASPLGDITEYGRVVHAEMDALLCCSRINVSAAGATMYCTTFPCHNCAKHIVSAGIKRVVYIEPYEKSRALQLNDDTIAKGLSEKVGKVSFEPFIGVGPRRFFDLYSMKLGSGRNIKRKNDTGDALHWDADNVEQKWDMGSAQLKIQMLPVSYLENEENIGSQYKKTRNAMKLEVENADQRKESSEEESSGKKEKGSGKEVSRKKKGTSGEKGSRKTGNSKKGVLKEGRKATASRKGQRRRKR